LLPRIYLRVFVGVILSARYCLCAVVGALLSYASLSMNYWVVVLVGMAAGRVQATVAH